MREDTLTGLLLDERSLLTLGEMSRACTVHAEWIMDLVEEGIIDPSGVEVSSWRFSGSSLHRARAAMHLQRDLGINLQGVALVLDLTEEIQSLRSRLRALEPEC